MIDKSYSDQLGQNIYEPLFKELNYIYELFLEIYAVSRDEKAWVVSRDGHIEDCWFLSFNGICCL